MQRWLYMFQEWDPNQRVLELSMNSWCGEDFWWNEVLGQDRNGKLSKRNCDRIHGYPTRVGMSQAPLRIWHQHQRASRPLCSDVNCNDRCNSCLAEKRKRNRLLPYVAKRDCTDHGLPAAIPPDFDEAIMIIPHSQAVFHYALKCARNLLSDTRGKYCGSSPRDTANAWFVAGCTKEEMAQTQAQWHFYNVRKTDGIFSLCPLCYDPPD